LNPSTKTKESIPIIIQPKAKGKPDSKMNELNSTKTNNKIMDLSKKKCFKCNKAYRNCKEKNAWISCEKCDNWICFSCLPKGMKLNESFYCDNCSDK
jgi:hypothetical protein